MDTAASLLRCCVTPKSLRDTEDGAIKLALGFRIAIALSTTIEADEAPCGLISSDLVFTCPEIPHSRLPYPPCVRLRDHGRRMGAAEWWYRSIEAPLRRTVICEGGSNANWTFCTLQHLVVLLRMCTSRSSTRRADGSVFHQD